MQAQIRSRAFNRAPALAALLAAAGFVQAAAADINFPDFASTSGLSLVGSAARSSTTMVLAPAVPASPGAMWFTERKQMVTLGFETEFTFRVNDIIGTGADGFAFVIQNASPTAIGGPGGAIGYARNLSFGQPGIPNSIAVEFDLWNNFPANWEDLDGNHVAIQTAGLQENNPSSPFALVEASTPIDMSDGLVHTARVEYVPGLMSVFLDDGATPVAEALVDLSTLLDYGDTPGEAWVGITAATGGATDVQRHEVLSWTFNETIIPAPGAGAVLAFGALAAARRRRR